MNQELNDQDPDMIRSPRAFLAGLALAGLAACGGGNPDAPGGGGGSGTDNAPAYDAAAAAFAEDTDAIATLAETDVAQMPTGSATYAGSASMVLELAGGDFTGAYANMTLEADFDGGTATGSLTDFAEQTEGTVPGELDIETGTITDNSVAANATGQITLPAHTIDLALDLSGTFLGDTAAAIDGTLIGTTNVDGTFEGVATGLFSLSE